MVKQSNEFDLIADSSKQTNKNLKCDFLITDDKE